MLQYNSYFLPLLCAIIIIQMTSSYVLSSSTHVCNYCFMQLTFKSERRRNELQIKIKFVLGSFIVICVFIFKNVLYFITLLDLLSIVFLFQPEKLILVFLIGQAYLERSSVSFCLSGKVLIFLYLLKDDFAGNRILSWYSFSFSTINTSSHCFFGHDGFW